MENKKQPKPLFHGKDISENLLKHYEENYMKKFPFEKGQFHQCIPNPYIEDEFITVMLVDRSLRHADSDNVVLPEFRAT